jgi:peptide/nickel transport system substrate-binding protein
MKQSTKLAFAASAFFCGIFAGQPSFAGRGDSGHLNLIFYQAASMLNPYLANGTKDVEPASAVLDPLARYDSTGKLFPVLAAEIPSIENGGIAADYRSVTWRLKPGLKWSDGSPFTAADVVFTGQYCMDPQGGCGQAQRFYGIESITAVDDLTVKIAFSAPKYDPFIPFVTYTSPVLQKAQFEKCLGALAQQCTDANFRPIGTGPFMVKEFRPNDVIIMEANPNFRESDKPAFKTATFKGGGSAAGAARAVLETGEFDYGWNVQVSPETLDKMVKAGRGDVIRIFGSQVEHMEFNLTNPSPDLAPDVRSTIRAPHPFMSDLRVRKALSMALDRELLSEVAFGPAGRATCNLVTAPAKYVSTANDACLKQDIAGANKLLDEAGWIKGSDGIRAKDRVPLSLTFMTTINPVRQDIQALSKQWWSEIGIKTELRAIDASVLFGSDPGNPDTYQKFYGDVLMRATTSYSPDPEGILGLYACTNIPSPETKWQGLNVARYCDASYDAGLKELARTGGAEERIAISKKVHDIHMQSFTLVPLVLRASQTAVLKSLKGVDPNPWDSSIYNIGDWYRETK